MTNQRMARQPEPRKGQRQDQPSLDGDIVPIIPGWVENGGFIFLMPIALVLLGAIAHFGQVYGAGFGWTLFFLAAGAVMVLWWSDYKRRLAAAQARRERALWVRHFLAAVDGITWRNFEAYSAELLRARGYRDVVRTGSTRADRGADIIATSPDGIRVAVQCKHRKHGSIGPSVVRELIGATSSGQHKGRVGIVMTNVPMTPGARRDAAASSIMVVDRPVLGQWMEAARSGIEQRGNAPVVPQRPSPATP